MSHTIRNLYVPPGVDLAAQRKATTKGDRVTIHLHSYGEVCSEHQHEYYENGQLNNGAESSGEVS